MCFVAYRGPAGPTREQASRNVQALVEVFHKTGRSIATSINDFDEVVTVVQGVEIVYDRWGFCSSDGTLDQAGWHETVAYCNHLFAGA